MWGVKEGNQEDLRDFRSEHLRTAVFICSYKDLNPITRDVSSVLPFPHPASLPPDSSVGKAGFSGTLPQTSGSAWLLSNCCSQPVTSPQVPLWQKGDHNGTSFTELYEAPVV